MLKNEEQFFHETLRRILKNISNSKAILFSLKKGLHKKKQKRSLGKVQDLIYGCPGLASFLCSESDIEISRIIRLQTWEPLIKTEISKPFR